MSSFKNIPTPGSEAWKDNVATTAELPTANNTIGDKRQALDTKTIYSWNGVGWTAIASPNAAIAITSLISEGGDVTATGPGAVVATLKTINLTPGSFGTASSVPSIAVNGKGLVTSSSNTPIQIAQSQVDNLITDLAGKFDDPTGTTAQYIRGDGSLATFPSYIDTAGALVTTIWNDTGAPLTAGTVVYISGEHGNLPTVTKAQANNDANSARTYGIVSATIAHQASGTVIRSGRLVGLNTNGFLPGTSLYLSPTVAGEYTATKPSAPNHMVYVATVVRQHNTQGSIEVQIQNGYELEELHDVSIASTPADGDLLTYELSTLLWKNKPRETTFLDSTFRVQDNTTPTKQLAFEVSSVTAGQTRTLTVPNASGRLQIEGQAIGDITPANGTFTTLTANTRIVGPQGANVGNQSSPALSLGANGTGFYITNNEITMVRNNDRICASHASQRFDVLANNGLGIIATGAGIQMTNDVNLFPVASGELHQRGSGAQGFLPYNTYTNSTNWERGFIRWKSNALEIGSEESGTGLHRPLKILQNGITQIEINNDVYLYNYSSGRTKLISGSSSSTTRELLFPNTNGTLAIEKYATGAGDVKDVESYNTWVNGQQIAFGGTNKWLYLSSSGSPGWFNLRVAYAMINGIPFSESMIGQEVYVDNATIYFTDYGWGLTQGNYTDFINNIFSQFNLGTQLYSTSAYKWIAQYDKTDRFFIVFEETGFIDDGAGGNIFATPYYFSIQSNGPNISDNIGSSFSEMVPVYAGNARFWTIL